MNAEGSSCWGEEKQDWRVLGGWAWACKQREVGKIYGETKNRGGGKWLD